MIIKKRKAVLMLRTFLGNLAYWIFNTSGLNKNGISVLCYHSISNKEELYSISYPDFKAQIEKILKFASFISLDEAVSVLQGKKIKTPAVVLTFDDGYEDVMKILPLTRKHSIPVTLFLLSETTKANRNELNNTSKFLSTKQVKYLISEGWKIGCHSATHSDFHDLSQVEIEEEIINSKRKLEKMLGVKIDYFAYPKGKFTDDVLKAVKKAGYKAAFSCKTGYIEKGANKWLLPRTVINKTHPLDYFPAVFSKSTYSLRDLTDSFNLWGRIVYGK